MKLKHNQKLLLACVFSAIVPVGLGLWLLAVRGWDPARPDTGATLALILAAGLLAAALAAAWASRPDPHTARESEIAVRLNHEDTLETWRQRLPELDSVLDTAEAAATIARLARSLPGVSAVWVFEADPRLRQPRLLASVGELLGEPTDGGFGEIAAGKAMEANTLICEPRASGDRLGVPLCWRGQCVGGLELRGQAGEHPFGSPGSEAKLPAEFELFTRQAAAALGHARLHQAAQRQAERLAILHQASQAIARSLVVEEIYAATYHAVGQVMPNDVFAILWLDDLAQTLEVAYLMAAGVPQAPGHLAANNGLMSQIVSQGGALVCHTPDDWPEAMPHFGQPQPAQSAVTVPMRAGEQILGVVTAQAFRAYAFADEDAPLLTTLASQTAAALRNARLFASTERQTRELDVLLKAQSAASASLDISAVLSSVAEQLGHALDVTSAYVIEVTEAYAEVVADYYGPEASDAERASDLHVRYPLPIFPRANRAMIQGVCVTLSINDEECPPLEREHLRQFGGRTALIVPLVRQGQPLGYASLWESRREREFTESEKRLAQAIAGNAAAAMENARLYAAARRHAEQMELVNQIGRDITGILESEALLVQVARRLETTFGYYHAKLGVIEAGEVVFPARTDERRQLVMPAVRIALEGPGIIAWVARNSQPRTVPDVQAEADYLPNPWVPDTVSEAVVPLIAHGHTLGVLDVQSNQREVPGPDEMATLEAISGQVAVAIDNARLFAEARQRAAEVSALLTTTLAVTSSLDLDARLQAIAEHARRLVEADACTIYELSQDGQALLPIVALDELYAEETLNDVVTVGEGLIGQAVQSGAGVLANRADLDPRAMQIPGTPATPESMMVVPLQAGQRVTGVMAVYREGLREFTQHDFDLLSSFAAQASAAIENAELYQKLRERADSLQATYNELAEMDRLKDEMVQNISHELRTPLTFLKGYVELLLSGALGPLQPEQTRSLQVVANKTSTLVRLVNDIITLQAVTPATIARTRLDLLEVARAAADGVAAVAQEAGVELKTELPPGPVAVHGDALRLTQVFDNLLGNALKFTGRGGQIHLSVNTELDRVRVEVRDTGIGIAPESVDRVFDRFYQVDGTLTRRRGGIGLGLAICKLIVEVHGGQIGVDSQVGAGSSFYFTLPMAAEA